MAQLIQVMIFAHSLIALIVSFFACWELFFSKGRVRLKSCKARNKRSCVKIMLMADAQISIPILMIYFLSTSNSLDSRHTISSFILYNVIGQTLSAFNPIVMICFGKGIQCFIRRLWMKVRCQSVSGVIVETELSVSTTRYFSDVTPTGIQERHLRISNDAIRLQLHSTL